MAMKRSLRAAALAASVWAPCAAAQPPPAAPTAGPDPGWRWSAFVSDVFDGERAAGLRRRLGESGALFASVSFDSERRDFGEPVTTRTRWGLAAGYRRLLGGGRLRGLLELEGRLTREEIDSQEATVSGSRNGAGGGVYTGFEYFFSPSFSLSARAGLAFESRDEAGGGETRQLTAFQPGVALSVYW
jgi:hypothetical protein